MKNVKYVGMAQSTKKHGQTLITLSNQEIQSLLSPLGTNTKKALTFQAIAQQQGIRTDAIRSFANCSNVPQAAIDANKKLMNYGLMLHCVKPPHGAYNSAFHFWYLIQAPIQYLNVEMAVNDGLF
ncbi:MAG: hypothetical protein ACTH6I_07050 [Vibrio litoralis]|uniref:hypothetical protein n=1 Tax=Vibrio litoralis TaxID=335972 RepID=UPI003F9E8453